ncbi:iron-dependent peroxidase-like [Hymenobacter roseosalivarius DSM 11622]|uniref:Iron-dependent peroxidase-like n=1 Tax=Hymenobacter roseosalivarius DSM 11622 TaxID=645990 RepID=A0A1W1UEP4_9BACT|nr:hypothetical protein [Hymenobacter roseosalivarius]SMB79566.1 iron-dependent peroxidase-like [Hymenobacter roseosalivarius DSM 11622]
MLAPAPILPVDLTRRGVSFDGPEFTALADQIQGNILKSHGRGHTSHIFFRFNPGQRDKAKRFIQHFAATEVTSAQRQKQDTAQTKVDHVQRFVIGLLLSASAYNHLGIKPAQTPPDPQFRAGMKASNLALHDAPVDSWDPGYRDEVHGMILVALGEPDRLRLDLKARGIVGALRHDGLATVLAVEHGDGIKNSDGEDIEHFGYVDGISQPKFFHEEITGTPVDQWNPLMPLNLVLVPDPGGHHANALGSYFVFRKLEQNVRGFNQREEALGRELFGNADNELAGAMVVGRFENGTPVTLHAAEAGVPPVNNFNYGQDTAGAKCPFHAHIRKSNPRGEAPGSLDSEKAHMMARRGIIYGHRAVHPNEATVAQMPTGGVGLLFMSFQSRLGNQFEFIQKTWVNNDQFVNAGPPKGPTGKDGVIGQGTFVNHRQKYAKQYNKPATIVGASSFGGFVTLKGGEYFFAPSLSFLKQLVLHPNSPASPFDADPPLTT